MAICCFVDVNTGSTEQKDCQGKREKGTSRLDTSGRSTDFDWVKTEATIKYDQVIKPIERLITLNY